MSQVLHEKLIRQVLDSLNKCSNGGYTEILERYENSIDFILEGDLRLVGINYIVGPRTSIRLLPIPSQYSDNGIRFNISVVAYIKDFTTGNNGGLQIYDFFDSTKYPLVGSEEERWAIKIERMNMQIRKISSHLMKLYTPSHRLSAIVGQSSKTKLEILDLVSEYILSNKLRLSNGHLKVEGYLKPFYRKDTMLVCENTFFDTLRENTLISEMQAKQFSFRSRCLPQLMLKNLNYCTVEYLSGLL